MKNGYHFFFTIISENKNSWIISHTVIIICIYYNANTLTKRENFAFQNIIFWGGGKGVKINLGANDEYSVETCCC